MFTLLLEINLDLMVADFLTIYNTTVKEKYKHHKIFQCCFTQSSTGKNLTNYKKYTVFRRFRKFWKGDYYLSHVRLSVSMEQLDSHWKDFDKMSYLIFFRKSVERIQVSLKSDKNNRYFRWRRFPIYGNISLHSYYNEKYSR
jgi:hypothetical protein